MLANLSVLLVLVAVVVDVGAYPNSADANDDEDAKIVSSLVAFGREAKEVYNKVCMTNSDCGQKNFFDLNGYCCVPGQCCPFMTFLFEDVEIDGRPLRLAFD